MTLAALSSPRLRSLSAWQRHGAILALAITAILLLFARDAADIATIWWTSSTFGHCILVPPIVAWLIWQRRDLLVALTPRTWAPGLTIVALGAFGWLLGDAAGAGIARHFGLVLMLQGATLALLGASVARAIAFPLAYLLFMVPFGEELVPPLQTITAAMAMALLDLVGIPAHIEGIFITTPTGYFEVAEACAGVNFLIAMLAFAVLVAHLCFRSWPRRIGFVVFAVTSSIVANGIRAWGTIVIAHFAGIDFAAGFDHIFYGWIFFALVIALVLAAGWRFFETGRPGETKPVDDRRGDDGHRVVIALAALIAAPLLWSAVIAATGREALPGRIDMPVVKGWQRVALTRNHPWFPHFAGADHRLFGRYRNTQGQEVDLAIVLYGYQGEGRELVGFGQGAVATDSGWAWTASALAPPGGKAERIIGPGKLTREVLSFYRVGDTLTGSATRVKLATLKTRLLGGSQAATAVLLAAEGPEARRAIDAFLIDLGPVDALADAIAADARGR